MESDWSSVRPMLAKGWISGLVLEAYASGMRKAKRRIKRRLARLEEAEKARAGSKEEAEKVDAGSKEGAEKVDAGSKEEELEKVVLLPFPRKWKQESSESMAGASKRRKKEHVEDFLAEEPYPSLDLGFMEIPDREFLELFPCGDLEDEV